MLSVSGLGFWPEDLGNKFRGWVQGVTVKKNETRGLDFKVEGLGFWAWSLGFRVAGVGRGQNSYIAGRILQSPKP